MVPLATTPPAPARLGPTCLGRIRPASSRPAYNRLGPTRLTLFCLAWITLGTPWTAPGHAQDLRDPAQNPLTAIRADRWSDAQAAAARFADPVAEKLVLYFRLRAPGAATASEIADFMQRNPDWPAQPMLERRRQDAIALDPDDAAVLTQCAGNPPNLPLPLAPPSTAGAMLRCAEALANAGRTAAANDLARQAWIVTIDDPATEAAFLRRWPGVADADDQWARFQRLAWTDAAGAARQVARLDPPRHAAATARLAARRDDPQAEALAAALPRAQRDDPGLLLDRARALRRADRTADAVALWLRDGAAAQRAAPGHLADFCAERNVLARRLLLAGGGAEGSYRDAYALVAAPLADPAGQTAGEPFLDSEFLAGFVALRLLHEPARAAVHFNALAVASPAAITQGRAHYWLGRTAAAAGNDPAAEYARAAAWPTTFYGQLAALTKPASAQTALFDRIRDLRDPGWTQDTVLAFTGHEVIRAAAWLVAWGDPQRARLFLLRMDELAPIPAERALTAAFALQLGMPDSAVAVARRMGRDGLALPRLGWPAPFDPPAPPDAAFSRAVMRQESSFDIGAVSASGARGLMQLMPPTATSVARQLGIPVSIPSLTFDSAQNMRLGTAYLQQVLTRFDGSLPLAAAAYNAGPHRVAQWLLDYGDPRTGPIDMVDWIELIPLNETRNYVQRVIENAVIYRAQSGGTSSILTTPWVR